MNTDIVERLRKYGSGYPDSLLLMRKAADEIERLRKDCTALVDHSIKLEQENGRLRAEIKREPAA